MLTAAEMQADISDRLSVLSPSERAAFRNATEFILKLAAEILSAPAADREGLYQLAKVEGARRGLVVGGLPATFDADAERHLRGFMPVAAAAERVTREATAVH